MIRLPGRPVALLRGSTGPLGDSPRPEARGQVENRSVTTILPPLPPLPLLPLQLR